MNKLLIMRKLLLASVITLTVLMSCTNDESPIVQENQKTFNGTTVSKAAGETDPKTVEYVLAIAKADVESLALGKKNETARPRIKYCSNSGFSGQNGSGYQQVTLDNGTVHYVFYTYYISADQSMAYSTATYLGTQSFDYMGC